MNFLNKETEEVEAIQTGIWENDVLNGMGSYFSLLDDLFIEGKFVENLMEGEVKETCGNELVFLGSYRNGVREQGRLYLPHDCSLHASGFDELGQVDGENCEYNYPNNSIVLKGVWEGGEMQKAKIKNESKNIVYSFDRSTSNRISRNPTLRDPYESLMVYVKESTVRGAGEGLFAKIDVEADIVVSFYNGVRITHKYCDSRPWDLNRNTISLNEEFVIDVPPRENNLSIYCASLGHKANHRDPPENNAVYDLFDHPRFGDIKCIRTIKPISRNEEIFVDYGYKKGTGPNWYREKNKK